MWHIWIGGWPPIGPANATRGGAELTRGRMKAKRSELINALDGRFDDHHAELARMLLAQIDAMSAQINTLTGRIEDLSCPRPP
jgi:transposase